MSELENLQQPEVTSFQVMREIISPLVVDCAAGIGSISFGWLAIENAASTEMGQPMGVFLVVSGAYVAARGMAKSLRSIQRHTS